MICAPVSADLGLPATVFSASALKAPGLLVTSCYLSGQELLFWELLCGPVLSLLALPL